MSFFKYSKKIRKIVTDDKTLPTRYYANGVKTWQLVTEIYNLMYTVHFVYNQPFWLS